MLTAGAAADAAAGAEEEPPLIAAAPDCTPVGAEKTGGAMATGVYELP